MAIRQIIGGCLALTLSLSTAMAAEFIGVTAALKGEVLRLASTEPSASIGALSSGEKIFLGDDIKVGETGRLQVLLVDETVFTLGAGAEMTIDKFVYDPNQTNELAANIKKGAFRFVSGKVAKAGKDAMKVSVPGATIAVRGTQVAGQASEDGESEIYLLGPSGNSFGATPGAIAIFSDAGEIIIDRPGFAINVSSIGDLSEPYEASPEQINQVQEDTQEGGISLAEALDGNVTSIDSDNDGQVDTLQLTGIASEALIEATAGTDAVYSPELATAILGEDVTNANFGYGLGSALAQGFVDNGAYAFADLSSISGSGVFSITNAVISGNCAGDCGTFNATATWTFATPTLTFELDGNINDLYYIPGDSTSTADISINFSSTQSPLASGTWNNSNPGGTPGFESQWNIDVGGADTTSVNSSGVPTVSGSNHGAAAFWFDGDLGQSATNSDWSGSTITTTGTGDTDFSGTGVYLNILVNTGLQSLLVGDDSVSTPMATFSVGAVNSSAQDPSLGAFGSGAALAQ